MQKHPTQTTQILLHLKAGNTINPLQALDMFGCFRLGARCWEIRKMGFNVLTKLIKTNSGAMIAEYSMGKNYRQLKMEL